MPRAAFLALAPPPARPDAIGALAQRLAFEGGWRAAGSAGAVQLWTDAEAGYPVRALPAGGGLVIGDLFARADADAGASPFAGRPAGSAEAARTARRLCAAHWGGYVALLPEAAGEVSLFRDPSGQVPCLTWRLADGVGVAASDLLRTPRWLWPPRLALNWARIALFVALPSAMTEPLLDGLEAVAPGALGGLGGPPQRQALIWRPGAFAGGPAAADLPAAKAELVARVDRCTADLAQAHDRLIFELSGGLDSSIVAASLGETGSAARVAQWLNRTGDRAEGDEQAFARSVTDRLGVELTVAGKPLTPLDEGGLQEAAGGLWPAVNGVDAARDRDEVDRLGAAGASAIMTGDGGDAVFFQMASALVWADEVRRRGLAALASPVLADVARRTRQSVWGVLRQAAAAQRSQALPPMPASRFVTREVAELSRSQVHPWVRDANACDLAPGKRLQIAAIANCQLFRGESRRSARADLLFPLLAQPVVELCLSIATPDLAGASYDRPFARAAFAQRLPPAILARRGKGNLTGYFGRLAAASRDLLGPYLLDGCLCEAGVLDRASVEDALDPARWIWDGRASGLLMAAGVEAWVRHWQGRVPDSAEAPRCRPAGRGNADRGS